MIKTRSRLIDALALVAAILTMWSLPDWEWYWIALSLIGIIIIVGLLSDLAKGHLHPDRHRDVE